MIDELYKLSGLLGFIIAWFGMLVAVFSQGKHKHKSISLHAANNRRTILLLAILSPISMSLFMVFVAFWLSPNFKLSPMFITLNIIAFAGYILAAWFPAVGGRKEKLHDIFALGASLLLIPISFMLATSSSIPSISRVVNAIAVILMVGIFCILLWHKPARKNYLYYQVVYFLAFDLSLLATGFIQ